MNSALNFRMKLPSLVGKYLPTNKIAKYRKAKIKDQSVANYYGSLPETPYISASLGSAYVINEPLLEVGGDGLWIHEDNDIVYFAVFDCMGHGRMATMMTRLYIQMLENTIKENTLLDPSEVITRLHYQVKLRFEDKCGYHLGTGADIGLIRVDKRQQTFKFSGAKMDLVSVNGGKVERLRSSKRAIGGHFNVKREYEDHEFSTIDQAGTKYYLYSDGVTDLFGGASGKKMGYRGLEKILGKLKNTAIDQESDQMKQELKLWEGGTNERLDDLLLVGFSID